MWKSFWYKSVNLKCLCSRSSLFVFILSYNPCYYNRLISNLAHNCPVSCVVPVVGRSVGQSIEGGNVVVVGAARENIRWFKYYITKIIVYFGGM